jgi:hypothetical protein
VAKNVQLVGKNKDFKIQHFHMNKPQIGLKSMKAGRLREMRMNMNELREWQDKVYKSGMGF